MNFFEHQQRARNQTRTLVTFFALAVIAIICLINLAVYFGICITPTYCVDPVVYLQQPLAWMVSGGTLLVIVLTSLIRWSQLKSGGGYRAVLMVGAKPVDFQTAHSNERQLLNVVEEMSIAAGMPMPRVFVMEQETSINAFVAGTEPHNTCLVVTRGCLEKLSRQELQGVIGHEYSHIFNGDMRLNIYLIGILAGILVIGQLGEFITRSSSSSGSSKKNNGLQLIVIGFTMMLAGYIGVFFGRLIKAAISRQREFLADASAVQYTRDPSGISNALYKIKTDVSGSLLHNKSAEELSHMCFERSHKLVLFSGLLATHPPIDARIKKIDPHFVPAKSSVHNEPVEERQNKQPVSPEQLVQTIVTAGALSASVGRIDSLQVDKAQLQIQQLPDVLKRVVHNIDSEVSPEQLVYALLVLYNTLPRVEILQQAGAWLSEQELNGVSKLLSELSPLSVQQRFLLLDMALPRIQSDNTENKQRIITKAKRLVDCDKHVSLQEYIIYSLLLLYVEHKKPIQKSITRYADVLDELKTVLSVFLLQGAHSDEKRRSVFTGLMKTFSAEQSHFELSEFNVMQFHRALTQLSRLSPLLKQPLIDTLAQAIATDNRLHESEFMLMRAVCEYLDCPLPKLL